MFFLVCSSSSTHHPLQTSFPPMLGCMLRITPERHNLIVVVLCLPEPQLSLITSLGLVWVSHQTKCQLLEEIERKKDQIPDDVDALCISIQAHELSFIRCRPAASTYIFGLIISGGFSCGFGPDIVYTRSTEKIRRSVLLLGIW